MRNKYGIIDFGSLEFIGTSTFGSYVTEEITDVLSEEQKRILLDVYHHKCSKIIYCDSISVEDDDGYTVDSKGIATIRNSSILTIFGINDNNVIVCISLYYNSGSDKYCISY